MITVKVTGIAETRGFLVKLSTALGDMRPLNEALGLRLAEEIKEHFRQRNTEGRKPGSLAAKLNAPKTNFWQKMADATKLETFTERSATVAVGTNHFNIHLFGGTILPGPGKKALTIPLITEAVGKRVANYQADTGRKLFSIRGKNALFERTGAAERNSEPGLIGRVRRRNGTSRNVGLISRTGVRAVYALRKSVKIDKDPDALPPMDALVTALQQEAEDFLAIIDQMKGGAS